MEIWGPSGGYLAALALRAAGLCAEIPRPASYYCHFLASPEFDEVELASRCSSAAAARSRWRCG